MGCTTSKGVGTAALSAPMAPADTVHTAIEVVGISYEDTPLKPEPVDPGLVEPEATCGYMLKEGSNWRGVKKRFFELHKGWLKWYEADGLEESVLGSVELCEYKIVTDESSDTRIELEDISGRGRRRLVIETASMEERTQWYKSLQQHIDYASRI